VFDPGFWASRASWGREEPLQPAFRVLAGYLLEDERAASINRFVHHLRLDSIDLHAIMTEAGYGNVNELDEARLELDVLQAIRLALIMRVMILAAQLPRFSPQNDTDYKQLLGRALALEVPEVVAFIRQAREAGFNPIVGAFSFVDAMAVAEQLGVSHRTVENHRASIMRKSGVRSLPVRLGVANAARLACLVMAMPQAIVIVLLAHWGLILSAGTVGVLLLVQFGLMARMLRDPKALAPWYNATGTSCYVLGMLAAALGLGGII
jgi:hypothetical protein